MGPADWHPPECPCEFSLARAVRTWHRADHSIDHHNDKLHIELDDRWLPFCLPFTDRCWIFSIYQRRKRNRTSKMHFFHPTTFISLFLSFSILTAAHHCLTTSESQAFIDRWDSISKQIDSDLGSPRITGEEIIVPSFHLYSGSAKALSGHFPVRNFL